MCTCQVDSMRIQYPDVSSSKDDSTYQSTSHRNPCTSFTVQEVVQTWLGAVQIDLAQIQNLFEMEYEHLLNVLKIQEERNDEQWNQ